MRIRLTLAVATLVAVAVVPAAAAGIFEVDATHSAVAFRVQHLGLSWTLGRFNEIEGRIVFDPARADACSVEMTIGAASIDTGNEKRDAHLREEAYLGAERHPTIRFVGRSWRKVGVGTFQVSGVLAFRGVEKPLSVRVRHLGTGKDPWGGTRAGFETGFVVKRSDFGMTEGQGTIGDEVHLMVVVQAIRRGETASEEEGMPPESNRMKDDHLPTPYGAEEIRKGCPAGRTSVYRVEAAGQPAFLQTMRFVAADEKGGELEISRQREDGTPLGEPARSRGSWTDFQAHASYPAAGAKVTTETIEVPAGKFDCWLYTVRGEEDGKETILRAWFAKEIAGPPILMTRHAGGNRVFAMTLVKHEIPGSGEE
jgi:polyisoprenoid-binding protein YceI